MSSWLPLQKVATNHTWFQKILQTIDVVSDYWNVNEKVILMVDLNENQ